MQEIFFKKKLILIIWQSPTSKVRLSTFFQNHIYPYLTLPKDKKYIDRFYYYKSGMRDSNSRPLGPKPSALAIWANSRERMVGVGGLEPPTSPLSEVRSNRLSYTPILFSIIFSGAKRQNRTADTRLFRPLLYHWATLASPLYVYQSYFSSTCPYSSFYASVEIEQVSL